MIVVVVQVIQKNTGRPANGKKVYISRDGAGFLDLGGTYGYEITDSDGKVYFSALKPCTGRINVSGQDVYTGALEEFTVVEL